jgi:hypothetical protein
VPRPGLPLSLALTPRPPRALRRRDDSLPARLVRYRRCGLWAGWLFCLLALLDVMLYRLAAWLRPDSDIEPAVDWPPGGRGEGEGEGEDAAAGWGRQQGGR